MKATFKSLQGMQKQSMVQVVKAKKEKIVDFLP
jgi:hypothetical protein